MALNLTSEEIDSKVDGVPSVTRFSRRVAKQLLHRSRVRVSLKDVTLGGDTESLVRDIEENLIEWNLNLYNFNDVSWALVEGGDMGLTMSEVKCLTHLVGNVGYEQYSIKRKESPDFVIDGRLGVEVKNDDNYKLSRKQLQAASELSAFHIYKSTRIGCELHDVIDWIGMNEYENITGYY